jgi:hypothetical protein
MTDFDLSAVDAQDEGELNIKHPKTLEPTGWIWTFYGPSGHDRTFEPRRRRRAEEGRARRQAQANG